MPPMPPKKSGEQTALYDMPEPVEVVTSKTPGYSHAEVFARYKAQVPVNSDHSALRRESMFNLPASVRRVLEPMCKDPRDYLCLELMLNTLLVFVPLWWAVWSMPLWLPEGYQWLTHLFAPMFILLFAVPPISLYQKYILTLHVTSHNKLFRKSANILNSVNEILINPFFGIPPGSYYLHHVVMHHRENNVFPRDMSSTMPYQRDSLSGLASYCLRYWTHQSLYLGYYAYKTERYGLLLWYTISWAIYIVYGCILYRANPLGTTWMVIASSFITGFMLMQGNFSQHMFIDPNRRFDNFGLAFNYINHICNQKTYNDGYHIIHHMNSLLHWSKIPKWFEDNIERFAIQQSVIFNGIDTMEAWFFTVTGNWKALHAAWVDLSPGPKRSIQFFREMIEERLVPLDGEPDNVVVKPRLHKMRPKFDNDE